MNYIFNKKLRIIALALLLVMSCVLVAAPVMAEGSGDGSGGGKNVPLGLDASNPADGARDVALNGDINLTFNKNVIYLQIKEANKKCFSLVDNNGAKVPIEVIMADDQTPEGFEKRREISLHPLEKLQPGTEYTVKVSSGLQAKNGTSLGHEVSVSFVTAGTAAKPAPAAPVSEPAKDAETAKTTTPAIENNKGTNEANPTGISEKAPAVEDKKGTGVENTPVTEDKSKQASEPQVKSEETNVAKENPQSESKTNLIYAIIIGLVLIAGAGYLQRRKRMHK